MGPLQHRPCAARSLRSTPQTGRCRSSAAGRTSEDVWQDGDESMYRTGNTHGMQFLPQLPDIQSG